MIDKSAFDAALDAAARYLERAEKAESERDRLAASERYLHARNWELINALDACNKAFAAWQCGQIPGRPEDILILITKVRKALSGDGSVSREPLVLGREHLTASGTFRSDKYPGTPDGKVPLSVQDRTAQDLLSIYASRRESTDAEFSRDLREALANAGYHGGGDAE